MLSKISELFSMAKHNNKKEKMKMKTCQKKEREPYWRQIEI